MRRTFPKCRSVLGSAAFLALAAALPASDAAAQMMRNSAPRGGDQAPASRPPPPALPGLQSRKAPEPIPGDPTQSLPPNAALFDAINRGDLPAARDAVARGADTEARNVLGLTPVDAAVDQGRTEIMFYLLSVRGASRPAGPPPEAERPASPQQRREARRDARREAAAGPASPRGAAATEAPVPVRAPRLWAGDGGAPNPAIGFLGFDAGRPAGAAAPGGAARGGGGGGASRSNAGRG